MRNFWPVGTKVMAISEEAHLDNPEWMPLPGTIGEIVYVDESDEYESYRVKWADGSTSDDDVWWCRNDCLELAFDEGEEESATDVDLGLLLL